MGTDFDQLAHDDPLPVRANVLDGADLHAQQREVLSQLLWRQLDIDELTQPGKWDAHLESLQEAHVVGEEGADIGDGVAQHGDAIGAHAEGEALVALRIDAAIAQHHRMHHA